VFRGDEGGRALILLFAALLLMVLALTSWRWADREGVYRFSARHLSGTVLGLIACVLAFVAFISLGDLAQSQRGSVPRDVTLLAPVQQAGSALTVEVANLGSLANKLREFLDSQKVKYVTISHSAAYTAQEIAASAHVRGKDMAKTVIVTLDGKMSMVVLPASRKVGFDLLKHATGAVDIQLASERAFSDMFPCCEVGAMPPFGNLFGMEVYASKLLAEDEEIAFNAGSHTELIRLSYKDFERLAKPKAAQIAYGE